MQDNPRTCEFCGGPNPRSLNARYCSPEHRSAAYSARKLAARQARLGDRTCKNCGEPIAQKKHPRMVFCSGTCQREWFDGQRTARRTAQRTAARTGRTCTAPGCGKPIPPELTANAAYCSDDCKRTVNLADRKLRSPDYMRMYLYGITPEQWDAQMAAQEGRCAICRSDKWPGKDNSPHADHDHSLLVFILRGILCGNCNNGLGNFGEDPLRLAAAILYLTDDGKPGRLGELAEAIGRLEWALSVRTAIAQA